MSPIAFKTVHGVRNLFAILVMAFVCPVVEASLALAQVTTDIAPTTGAGDLGTIVTPNNNVYGITEGTPVGNNLFHSFAQFSVGTGDVAQFQTTALLPNTAIHNILGRVTGQNPSSIFGTIDSASYYPGANLFLMNPNGIIFGPNATVNVGGIMAFTTADYLRLADGALFNAIPNATVDTLLSAVPVAAFGFLGSNPATIAVQRSILKVEPGQSISLVGGNQGFTYTNPDTGSTASVPNGVTMTGGTLSAQSGQVHIASVASQGEILAGTLDQTANINGQSFDTLGTIQISKQSHIDTSGEGGGTILIRGGRLVIDDSKISANIKTVELGTGPYVGPLGAGIDIHVAQDAIFDNGTVIETNAGQVAHNHGSGGVRITADHITISGGPEILAIAETDLNSTPFAGIRSNVEPNSTAARSGDISLNATSSIQIKDSGQIETKTGSAGNAGHIMLKASGDIALNSIAIVQSLSETSSGHAGNITFSSSQGNISVINSGVTSQADLGNAGNIKLDAPNGDIILDNGAAVFNRIDGTGTLGGIQITANNLLLDNNSFIVGNNFGNKVAGDTVITLDGRFTLAGNSAITTEALGPANAADLIIRARDILITDGSSLISGTFSSGAGGVIDLSARSLTIENGGKITAETFGTTPSATGGSIIVKTTDHVTMADEASITASSAGPGNANAGDISINAGQQLDLMGNSSVTTEAKQASGGDIDIRAIDRVRLVDSSINTSVFGGDGNGGNITIDPNVVVLQGSQVKAEAFQGVGGDITITTPLFLADSTSTVSALSPFGLNGTVTIQSPTSNLSGSLGPLASKPSQAQALLTQRCAALANGQASSFVVAGREQLPSDPGGWLSSPLAFAALGQNLEADYAIASTPTIMPIVDHDTGTVSLRRLTPAGFLMANFAESAATGCHS